MSSPPPSPPGTPRQFLEAPNGRFQYDWLSLEDLDPGTIVEIVARGAKPSYCGCNCEGCKACFAGILHRLCKCPEVLKHALILFFKAESGARDDESEASDDESDASDDEIDASDDESDASDDESDASDDEIDASDDESDASDD
jgi:hypothetical protein